MHKGPGLKLVEIQFLVDGWHEESKSLTSDLSQGAGPEGRVTLHWENEKSTRHKHKLCSCVLSLSRCTQTLFPWHILFFAGVQRFPGRTERSADHVNPFLHTVTWSPLSLFQCLMLLEARGKWECNISFPFRLRGMWHSADGFCRSGPSASPPLFLLRLKCRLVNWLALIRPVQVPDSSSTAGKPDQNSSALIESGHLLSKQICVYLKWMDWAGVAAVFCY